MNKQTLPNVKDFKDHEIYSSYKVPDKLAFFVRCNGRNFRKVCRVLNLRKPFDERLIKLLLAGAYEVFRRGFNAILAYIFSDEVNFLFIKNVPFNRRVEKIISLIPSLLSSRFSLELFKKFNRDIAVSFDARIIPLQVDEVVNYLAWRQLQCFRNCLNCYAYYSLIERGHSPREVNKILKGRKAEDLVDIIYRWKGIKLNEIPLWQRRGVLLYWELFYKTKFHRLTGEKISVKKRRLREEWNLPIFSKPNGRAFLEAVLGQARVI